MLDVINKIPALDMTASQSRLSQDCLTFRSLTDHRGKRLSSVVCLHPTHCRKYIFDDWQVLLRLAEDDRFVDGVAGEPDYEEPVLRKAHHILTSKQLGEYEHAARLDKLIAQVSSSNKRLA